MKIRAATAADLPDYAEVGSLSMYDDEIIEYTSPYRAQNRLSYLQHFLMRGKKRFYSGQFMFVAETEADDPEWDGRPKIVGYSCYTSTLDSVEKPKPGGFLGNRKIDLNFLNEQLINPRV